MSKRPKRTIEEQAQAEGKTVPDILAPNLWVLFCGINPGLYSAITGHHFARPGNRFWRALHRSGFTDRQLHPSEEQSLLTYGIGVTNLVARTTATAAELLPDEIQKGGAILREKVATYRPQVVAVLGVTAYRVAFQDRTAKIGRHPASPLASPLWILPNPSGLNAHFTPDDLATVFGDFRNEIIHELGAYQP